LETVGQNAIDRNPTAIEEVCLGCRVPDQNPRPEDYDFQFGEVDQVTWRQVGVTLRRADGAIVEMQLLRPVQWIRDLKLEVGREFTFFMSDIEVDGRAIVTAIGPCCKIADGPGSVVIGCFVTRDAADLVEVELENGTTIVGTSAHHIWHADEQRWFDLGVLREGDRLDTLSGPVRVQSIAPANELSDVYNIEVHGHHVYRITNDGILVHNSGSMAVAPKGTLFSGGMFGRTPKQVLKAKPKNWHKVPATGNGWKLVDENGVERIRFMRPDPSGGFHHQRTGYWRIQDADGNFLDEFGNIVSRMDPDFHIKTHIPFSGT